MEVKRMTDEQLEELIKAKGLTAARVTHDRVKSRVVKEDYIIMPSGKTMICELTLVNGYTVRGEASVVSKENFDEEIGRTISKNDAMNKIWGLEGYLLQEARSVS